MKSKVDKTREWRQKRSLKLQNEYKENFENIIKLKFEKPHVLTPKGFDEESEYNSNQLRTILKISWNELLIEYGLCEDLYQYIKSEFELYINKTNSGKLDQFYREHQYITQRIVESIDRNRLKNECGFILNGKTLKFNLDLLIKNFNNVKEQVKNIPTITEFLEHTEIAPTAYMERFQLSNQNWSEIVKNIVTEDEYNEYLKRIEIESNNRLQNLIKKGIENSIKNQLTDEELDLEFKRVFDYYIERYGIYPTRRQFVEMSVYSEKPYMRKYNLRWSDLIEFYGYTPNKKHKSETIVIENIRSLTSNNYNPQHTWDWLINDNGNLLFVDAYFPELNLVIEYDGIQHFEPIKNMGGEEAFIRNQLHDSIKNKLLNDKGIILIRFNYKDDIQDMDLISSKLEENNIVICNNSKDSYQPHKIKRTDYRLIGFTDEDIKDELMKYSYYEGYAPSSHYLTTNKLGYLYNEIRRRGYGSYQEFLDRFNLKVKYRKTGVRNQKVAT